jgi:intracellular sulfur oxidation DsrE/DsrF family protein
MMLGTRLLAVVLLAAATLGACADTGGRYGKQKVVYHINYAGGDKDAAYRQALNNVQNHINAVGAENIEVKVVLHGLGVDLLKDAKTNDALRTNVASLKAQNVAFNVCANTLKGRKIDAGKDLYEVFDEDVVPSGVAELARLQGMGYTYIKP